MGGVSIAILLIPYALFLLVFVVYAGINVYHLLRFGVSSGHVFFVTGFFVIGSLLLLGLSFVLISHYDWTLQFSFDAMFQTGVPSVL